MSKSFNAVLDLFANIYNNKFFMQWNEPIIKDQSFLHYLHMLVTMQLT